MRERPIGVDLFAGAGGLSLGFEQAGFDVLAAVEYDPIHAATHEFNFPGCATICRSVADIDGDFIRSNSKIGKSDVDVVFGGAPCQGFSMIGKRALDDPRNHLVHYFVRVVSELRPKYFVFENVRGLTVGEHKKFLKDTTPSLPANSARCWNAVTNHLRARVTGRRKAGHSHRRSQSFPLSPAKPQS